MAGDFNPDEVIAIIDKYFGSWQPGDDVKQPEFPALAPITTPHDTTVYGLEAETIMLGWRFDRGNSLQADTLEVIGSMLSNGTAGLIDLDINQQMQMLYAYAGSQTLRDYTSFIMGGSPRPGQTLEEAQALMLAEIEKLKSGDFSDDLLPSVINNAKLDYYNSMESNMARANMFVDTYINEVPWEQSVGRLDRISNITKDQIVAFANRHFNDNYVVVYKRQGVDENQKKISPSATPKQACLTFMFRIRKTVVSPCRSAMILAKSQTCVMTWQPSISNTSAPTNSPMSKSNSSSINWLATITSA